MRAARSVVALIVLLDASRMICGAEEKVNKLDANPAFTPPDTALFDEGRYVYERNCILCHGERGDGKGEMSASLSIKPRAFVSGLFKYRSTPWGKLPATADLIHTIRNGRTGTAMGMFTN